MNLTELEGWIHYQFESQRLKKRRDFFRDFLQAKVNLGRDPGCDAPLADKSKSPRQARISFQRGQLRLEDLQSSTGTRLNHRKLSQLTVLTVGDEIKCGQVRVVANSTLRPVQSEMPGVASRNG